MCLDDCAWVSCLYGDCDTAVKEIEKERESVVAVRDVFSHANERVGQFPCERKYCILALFSKSYKVVSP